MELFHGSGITVSKPKILTDNEDYVDGIIRVYDNPICEIIDNFNSSAYYEPSYVIAKANNEGGF